MLTLARDWWVVAVRGVAALLFGVTALFAPGVTFEVLVLLFGAYALVDGLFALVTGIWAAGAERRWWPMVLIGVVGILTGVLTFAQPAAVALALVSLMGAWAILTGALEVVVAIALRKAISNEWLLVLGGVASVVFGVLVLANPGAGALTLVLLFGAYAIVYGVMLVGVSLRLRGIHKQMEQPSPLRQAA